MNSRTSRALGGILAALLWPCAAILAQTDIGTGEVKLDKEKFGVGGVARPGEWIGVRVQFTDSAPKQRELVLRAVINDSDGDRPILQREVTANPGVKQGTWLYLRLPSWFQQGDTLSLEAYEAIEATGGGSDVSPNGYRAGRLLGRAKAGPQGFVSPANAVIAVLGPKALGLRRYEINLYNEDHPVFGHELTSVEFGLTPADLPDRWIGLAPFDAVVWGAGNPGEVTGDRAAALKEWVARGGHLVIILPAVGENWTNPGAHELHDLLPRVTVTRREGVDLNQFRLLLTDKAKLLPTDVVVHEFTPLKDATPAEASRVLSGPDGTCVVARRLVGTGAVTLIGLDLGHRLVADADVIEPTSFWNRVLGRRARWPSELELNALDKSGRAQRPISMFDTEIASQIAKTQSAAEGVLLGFVVFILYWGVAGPGGYALLKKKGMVRHAWLSFLLAAGAFTVIAWGGAEVIRPKRVLGTHLTFLDHVYGQPTERARSWMSLLIPRYGEARVSVGDPLPASAGRLQWIDLAAPWEPPPAEGGTVSSFPDSRGYVVDTRAPNSLTIPTRSTVKQLRLDWAGGPPWKMPMPVAETGSTTPGVVRLRPNRAADESWLEGRLRHDLPGPLHGVTIWLVPAQKALDTNRGNLENQLIAEARAFAIVGEWEPGPAGELDLDIVTRTRSSADDIRASSMLEKSLLRAGKVEQYVPVRTQEVKKDDWLTALAFFSQLEPAAWSDRASNPVVAARRLDTHGWDLGRWFTQPCVIVVGILGTPEQPQPTPIPLFVDGEPAATQGRTVVRWIYPLPDDPPPYRSAQPDDTGPAPADGALPGEK